MAENMMNKAHKATNENYRNNYDETFRKKEDKKAGKQTPRVAHR